MRAAACFLLMLLTAGCLHAQFSVEGSVDRNRVALDETLVYSLEISGKDANNIPQPKPPTIPGFSNQGSSSSSSTSMTIVNGAMETKVSVRYDYYLKPQREGKFTIPPVMVTYKGSTQGTRALAVEVTAAGTGRSQSRNSNRRDPFFADPFAGQRSAPPPELSNQDVWVGVELDKHTAYQGEAITVHYTLYSKLRPQGLEFGKFPEFDGFWKEQTFVQNKLDFQSSRRNGATIYSLPLMTAVLTPNRSGTLSIPSLSMQFHYTAGGGNFFGFAQPRQMEVKSPVQTVTVKPLPNAGCPAGFGGAVGSFEVSADLSPQRLKVGDAFTYTLRVRGSSALPYFTAPTPPQATQVRFLDPEITSRSGEKTVKYAGIAQEEGNITLPSVEFTYFDPARSQYVTKKTDEFALRVDPGAGNNIALSQTSVNAKLTDIAPIQTKPALGRFRVLPESPVYWLFFILAGLSVIPARRYGLKRMMLAGDAGYRREHAAERILHRYLNLAAGASASVEFYAAAQTGLSNYLCDKLRIPRGVSTIELLDALRESDLAAPVVEKTGLFLKRCQEARFMPGGFTPEAVQEDFRLLKALIGELTVLKRRKRAKAPKTIATLLMLMLFATIFATPSAGLWKTGTDAYLRGDFPVAIDAFSQLEREGVRTPALYVNLGDACYRQGRIGEAILNYKRALRLEPSAPAAKQSLAFAMTRTVEAQSYEPADALLRFIQRLFHALPLNLMALLWLLLFVLAIAALNWILICYPGRERTLPLFVLTVFVALWAIWGTVTVLRWVEYRNPDEGVITASMVSASPTPGQAGASFTLHEGFVVRITATEKNHTRIKLPNGLVGWVPSDAVTEVK
jgi:hypothetical protein